jgi:UDP-2,3-diacylglucosamine pyrophosphatase LpxH
MVIVAASDQHLGYDKADKPAFHKFLDQIDDDPSVTHLVLLGDVVDMWRRDASGVFLENRDTFDKIASLQKKIHVHYVAGNHDFHVNKLKGNHYPFNFIHDDCKGINDSAPVNDCLLLSEDGRNYRFVHGHQFDHQQFEPWMEALCRTMSDTVGDFESGIWAMLTRDWTDLHYFLSKFFEKRSIRKNIEGLQEKPEKRLANTLDAIEREACSHVKKGEILVFGHTHHPFINKNESVVNTGSWVKDALEVDYSYNTYVRLEATGPKLFVLDKGEITERIPC